MADSRTKGASFERDICKRLNAFFLENGVELSVKRNLDQYQSNGLPDIQIPYHAIECKAYKSGWWYSTAWWKQVCDACGDLTPILVWKFNNKPIRVTLPLYAINPTLPKKNDCVAVVTFDEWLAILSETVLDKNDEFAFTST